MKTTDDKTEITDDDLFVQKAKALFDDSVEGLDGQTQSRLNRSRQAAIASLDSGTLSLGRWTQWAPAAGAAAIAVVAVSMWTGSPQSDLLVPGTANDFELIMAEDSFDMLQDLEFYSWLDVEIELELGQDNSADVG